MLVGAVRILGRRELHNGPVGHQQVQVAQVVHGTVAEAYWLRLAGGWLADVAVLVGQDLGRGRWHLGRGRFRNWGRGANTRWTSFLRGKSLDI